tara:strand:- start:113939 stop:114115 length:177 start_codon:yes stop_codon:yes gene_type:complete
MSNNNKATRIFTYAMLVLSIIAVLMGLGVLYWIMQFEPTRTSLAAADLFNISLLIDRA